jgi:hypothetical protein
MQYAKDFKLSFQSFFDVYTFVSLASLSLFWVYHYYFQGMDLGNSFFLSSLIVSHYFLYVRLAGSSYQEDDQWLLPGLFLAQIFGILFASVEINDIHLVYASYIPLFSGISYFSDQKSSGRNPVKGSVLFIVTFISVVFIQEYIFDSSTSDYFYGQWGIIALSVLALINSHNDMFIKSWFAHDLSKKAQVNPLGRERIFFHDLINQTHSMGLLIGHKIKEQEVLELKDLESLKSEIETMQSILKDHYNLSHKNLVTMDDYIDLEKARAMTYKLLENYLGGLEFHVVFLGHLFDEENLKKYSVYYPTFIRIITNLVKNISETSSKRAEIIFDLEESYLKLVVKNQIYSLEGVPREENLGEMIEDNILRGSDLDEHHVTGLGLESIMNLAEEVGGTFSFKVDNGHWVNEVRLPVVLSSTEEKEENFAA